MIQYEIDFICMFVKKTYLVLVSVDQREKLLMFFCLINPSSGVLVQILRGHCLVCECVCPPVIIYMYMYVYSVHVWVLPREHLQLKQEALGSIPSGCPGFFLFQLAYTNVNGMKDLWCSSTVWLLSTQI